MAAHGGFRKITMEAQILGPCRFCGLGAEFWTSRPDCPHDPTFRRNLGVVGRWHKNPLVRAWYRLTKAFA